MDKESIIEKVRALIALSDMERNSSASEAETAAIKAQELIRKYNIQMADVLTDDNLGCELEIEQCEFSNKLTHQKWETYLSSCICLMTETQSFLQSQPEGWKRTRYKFFFVGTKEDCEVAKELYIFLYKRIVRIANTYEESFSRRSFILGFLSSLYKRIEEKKKIQETTSKYEMVLVKKNEGISNYLDSIGVRKMNIRNSSISLDPEAYFHGRQEGENVDIGQKKLEVKP